MDNVVQVANTGEIYQILLASSGQVPWNCEEIALATFSGLHFGRIKQVGLKLEWDSARVYFRDKLISQVCLIAPDRYLVAEYSQPGYYIIDRTEIPDTKLDSSRSKQKPPPAYIKIQD